MKRLGLVLLVSLALSACAKSSTQPQRAAMQEPAPRPNILFILTDDLGWGDLKCYGHPAIRTPHLDNLAKQGTIYTQFYVNASVCSPSRTAFMTGRYPARFGIHGHLASHALNAKRGMPNWLDPKAPMLTQLLKDAGYATAHFGKWHLGSGDGAPDPGAYGIDDHRTVHTNGPAYEGENENTFRAKSTGLFVDDTIRFIEANRGKPWYVNLWTLVPHATLNPTEADMKPYRNRDPQGVPFTAAATVFYSTVTAMDRDLGRLFQKLDELGLAENTLILFSSDNGPEDIHIRNASHSGVGTPGPFRGRKRSLYEGGVRMPFIVRWPARIKGGRVDDDSVVTAVDFLPTLCRLAGAKIPEGFEGDGEDVRDILLGATRPRTTPIFWEWRFRVHGYKIHSCPILSVREGKWKLLMNPDGSRVELYDIPGDPMEVDNLAAQNPDVVQKLSKKLLAWQKELPEGPLDADAGNNTWRWPGK